MTLIVCLSFLLALNLPVFSVAADDATKILENVRNKYDSIQDAELRFTQEVRLPLAKVEQRVDGTLLLKKKNKYRIELRDRTIVTDGITLWSYAPSTHQVLIDKFKTDQRPFSPEKLLVAVPSDFSSVIVGREKVAGVPTVVLKLTPRDENSFITGLKVWVAEGEWILRKVELVDISKKQTTYVVHEISVNTGLADVRFTFQVPEGAEVVDLREN